MATVRIQRRFRTYQFRNKNPIIDKMRTVAQDEGLYSKKQRNILHHISGVATSTYNAMWDGETISPNHKTIAAFFTSLGYEESWRKSRKINIEEELELAKEWADKENKRAERERALATPAAKRALGNR
jgi:hypothetical protein